MSECCGAGPYSDGPTKMKISEWIDRNVGSHEFYDKVGLAADFERTTGRTWPASIPVYTKAEIEEQIKRRGLGGMMHRNVTDQLVNGWDVVEGLEIAFVGTNSGAAFEGRGSRYRAAFEAIRKAGL